MGLRQFDIQLDKFSAEASLRCDTDFIDFSRTPKEKSFSFGALFDVVEYEKKDRLALIDGIEDIPFQYSEIGNVTKQGDVEAVTLDFSTRDELVEDYFKKIEKGDIQTVQAGNILLSKVRPNLKKYVLIDNDLTDVFYTTALIQLRPKKLNKLLYYSFRTVFYNNLMSIARQGKGYPTLKIDDLFCIKLDSNIINIFESNEQSILDKIEPIEKNIKKLKSKIKVPQEVINRVFSREFGFNLERFEALKKVKIFDIDFSHYGNNKDLRNSVKFHRQAGQFVLDELKSKTSKKIKDYISEPIVLGKGISPAQYDDDNGEYYYLSMATIKNWKFEKENARLVTDKFASDNQDKTIQVNDIILARSGEGTIGKVSIIDDEELNGIFADFTMRIRLTGYNQLFAYYYFRTEYFQYLVEINKKGLGNNTNIFPSQIQEFPLLDIPAKEQGRIVLEIKTELDAQEKIKVEIAQERYKIDEIIENAIKNS
jgi:type I restriction enzyme, S subunit